MINYSIHLWMLFAGVGLGVFYYGGLWWTLKRLPAARLPALWTLTSFLVRTATVGFGFYVLMAGDGTRVLVALGGFLVSRTILVSWIGPVGRRRHLSGEGSAS